MQKQKVRSKRKEWRDKKSKNYTSTEKSLFLQILNKYKHIIECKKSNANTLRAKEDAWNEISEEFNNSLLILQEVRRNFYFL